MRYLQSPETGLTFSSVIPAVERAFENHCEGEVQMPPKVYVTFPKGDFRTMPAYIPALDIAGVKIVNVHPDNRAAGLPTVMALTVILDIDTGKPVALLNATRLTDMRTGAAGAVAAKYLAPKPDIVLGLIGSGRQAEAQLEAVSEVCALQEFRVWSRDEKNAEALISRYPQYEGKTGSLETVCDCDVLCTTTPSRTPIIRDSWIREGTHINAIGADAPGKQELDPAILLRAGVFIDDYAQATHSGEINVPVSEGLYDPALIRGTLGEVVCGKIGRKNATEITVFDSTGLALQDLAIASIAMQENGGVELTFP
ncbi:MAG: ornithine cyclodeaminase family protein [Methanomicrobiaceae archaeon]|nr:ornithine cyclodeaminase family protein [Methanomicrobiaceae archaeon]